MTVISKGTPTPTRRGSGKEFAGFLGEILEVAVLAALFARCAVIVESPAGNDVLRMFPAEWTGFVHPIR